MRLTLFEKDGDYQAFEGVLAASLERADAPKLLAFSLMPNHWHLVVQAGNQTNLSTWMHWVTVTHVHRWHAHYNATGDGPLYQGRFKSFPVQDDAHFLTVCRYVEANAPRAKLVPLAENWRWASLWCRRNHRSELGRWLSTWPVERPTNWTAAVNRHMDRDLLNSVRRSVACGAPLGTKSWRSRITTELALPSTTRPRGRPRKYPEKSS
jgi:putative transposase